MPLSAGTRLGPYEIVELIGAGGMGEVYRARDAKLNRDVALKVLPEAFTVDTDRLARFKPEAHALAALNDPNIATIYGLEESDHVRALVLELVDGPTLADRIASGRLPIDEALPIAKQIVDAIEAAHEQADHPNRDLKPANIKLRPDAQRIALSWYRRQTTVAPPVHLGSPHGPFRRHSPRPVRDPRSARGGRDG